MTELVHAFWEIGFTELPEGWICYARPQDPALNNYQPAIWSDFHPRREQALADIKTMIDPENRKIRERHFEKETVRHG